MLRELITGRGLIWRLFIRDFTAKYRQSALGIAWALIMPLVTIVIFVGMRQSGILNIKATDIPYPLYALIGLTIWSLFSVGLAAGANSLINAGSMIVKINFPKIALVFSATGQGIVELLIRTALVALVFVYYQTTPDWLGTLLALLCLIPLYLMTVGLGFFFSLLGGVLRDIGNMLNMLLMGGLLITPILYPINGSSLLADLNNWNPFNYLINTPRDLVLRGHTDHLVEFGASTVLSLIIFYIGWRFFYLAQTKIAERI